MPGKSRHGKRKHFHDSKKSKQIMRQDSVASPVNKPAAATPPKPAVNTSVSAAAKAAVSLANAKSEQHAYVPGDLRRIGILSVIIIVILFVLYFVLS